MAIVKIRNLFTMIAMCMSCIDGMCMINDELIPSAGQSTIRRATPYCPPMNGNFNQAQSVPANIVSIEEFNKTQEKWQKDIGVLQSKVSAFQMELQKKDEEIAILQRRLRENEEAQKNFQEMITSISEQMSAMVLKDDLTKLRQQQKTQGSQILSVQSQNMALQQQVQPLDERLGQVEEHQETIAERFSSLQHQIDVLRQKDTEEEASTVVDLTVKQEKHKEDIAEATVTEIEEVQKDSIQGDMQPAPVAEASIETVADSSGEKIEQPEQLPLNSIETESEARLGDVAVAAIEASDSGKNAVPLEYVSYHLTLGQILRIEQWKAELPVVYVDRGKHKQPKEDKQKIRSINKRR